MRWLAAAVLGLVLAGAAASVADARPGGGHSYSGGGGRSYSGGSSYRSSGGGSGGGAVTGGAVIAIICGAMVVIFVVGIIASSREQASWNSQVPTPPATRRELEPLVAVDPAFSLVVFEDFAFELYARAQRARGRPEDLVPLTPYIASDVLDALGKMTAVGAVVIGSLRVVDVTLAPDDQQILEVRIEANLASSKGTTNVIERWTFRRGPDVTSRAPDRTRTFPCPKCNAPFSAGSTARTCAHCGTEMSPGKLDWTLTAMQLGASTSVGLTLTGTVAEVGNDLPTSVDDDAYAQMQALYEADKNVTWDTFAAHVKMTYAQLNLAWNAQDLAPVRGLVTAALLGYLQYWVDEYKRQSLANKLENATIIRIALAKVQRDAYYDAVTVRVFASGFDYTIDAKGNVVGGQKSVARHYTEYWTFIRSAKRRGPVTTEPKCPNCGAPLSISDAGACTHCNALIEAGDFDWTLSKIEQDEVYIG